MFRKPWNLQNLMSQLVLQGPSLLAESRSCVSDLPYRQFIYRFTSRTVLGILLANKLNHFYYLFEIKVIISN